VASVHGQSELRSLPGAIYDGDAGAFVSAHIQPERPFGFIGSGDGHDGHPGLTHIVGGKGGLAGVLASATDAASVLASLRARSVYATTGPRIVLRFSVGGLDMGAVAPASDEPVDAVLRVVGTEAIDRVDLVRRSGVVATVAGDGPVLHAEWRLDGLADDFVYVRVVQMDGMLAWSSPIIYAAAGAD
jgi:hypothetical protein